jgi:hypothetical protein
MPVRRGRPRARQTACLAAKPLVIALAGVGVLGVYPLLEGQRRVLAVEEFYGGENQFRGPDVLKVVEQVFAWAEGEVAGLPSGVADLARCSVGGALAAAAGHKGNPEVVQDVAVRAEAFAGLQPDFPHPYPVRHAEQPASHAAVVGIACEVVPDGLRPSGEILSHQRSGEWLIGQRLGFMDGQRVSFRPWAVVERHPGTVWARRRVTGVTATGCGANAAAAASDVQLGSRLRARRGRHKEKVLGRAIGTLIWA